MKKLMIWAGVLALLAFFAGMAVVFNPFNITSTPDAVEPAHVVVESAVVQREVILYFGDIASPFLVQEVRFIGECATDQECVVALVQELIAGPVSELVPALPGHALLLDAKIVDATAELNFNQSLITYHPGGSTSELLTVHALVNTIAANFPYIRKLLIRVDGKAIATLRGHVDLRQPIVADFSLVRQESEVPTVEVVPQTSGEQPQ
ncbi:MAG: GerMN domain-containing protein [Deltaproteobacteria bacterium]|nr:GerMN domain-containing protein [Deltaproteobacteria bacterium]